MIVRAILSVFNVSSTALASSQLESSIKSHMENVEPRIIDSEPRKSLLEANAVDINEAIDN